MNTALGTVETVTKEPTSCHWAQPSGQGLNESQTGQSPTATPHTSDSRQGKVMKAVRENVPSPTETTVGRTGREEAQGLSMRTACRKLPWDKGMDFLNCRPVTPNVCPKDSETAKLHSSMDDREPEQPLWS